MLGLKSSDFELLLPTLLRSTARVLKHTVFFQLERPTCTLQSTWHCLSPQLELQVGGEPARLVFADVALERTIDQLAAS